MWLRNVILVMGLAACLWCPAPASARQPATYRDVFEGVWTAVSENFYDPKFQGLDWAAVGARYRARLPAVQDERAFRNLLAQMLGELKSSHLYVAPPDDSPTPLSNIGARPAQIDGAWIFDDVPPLTDARRQGISRGDRLIGDPKALVGLLGETAKVTFETCAAAVKEVSIRREDVAGPAHPGWQWERLSARPGHSLGYLKIDRFDDGAASLADQAMSDLWDTDALIIDLRGNVGGNMSALRLASYFAAPGEAPAIALFSREYLSKIARTPATDDVAQGPKVAGAYTDAAVFKAVADHHGAAVFYTEPLQGRRYGKPVVVLIGPNTGSAGEGFAWAMRWSGSAVFIGRSTAGALLSGERFPIAGGWAVTLPVFGLWGPHGEPISDRAVAPDVVVTPTRDSLCKGRDLELETALERLQISK